MDSDSQGKSKPAYTYRLSRFQLAVLRLIIDRYMVTHWASQLKTDNDLGLTFAQVVKDRASSSAALTGDD